MRAFATAALLLGMLGGATRQASDKGVDPGRLLHKHTRELLAQARAEGASTVSLVIASRAGRNSQAAARVIELGGTVRFRNDEVDYLRAILPAASVEELAGTAAVQRVDLDVSTALFSREADQAASIQGHGANPPDRDTPAINPYLPTHVMGVPQFVANHPTFDGRGVTIAVIEPGIDLLTPELQTAVTLTGEPTHKVIDVLATTDPQSDDPMWVHLDAVVTSATTTVDYRGQRYAVPRPGTYRIGILDERHVASIGNDDLNRDGNPPGGSREFGVLLDPNDRVVWVDVNQNLSFADQPGLKNYRERFDIGLFKPESTDTPRRARVPFAVQIADDGPYVRFILGSSHGTMVATTATATGLFGGAMRGVAPGAQLVIIHQGAFAEMGALIEALVYGFRHPRVDIVQCSCGANIELNDAAALVIDLIVQRLVDRFHKPLVAAAGNNPGWMNEVGSPATTNGAFGVSGYIDRDTYAANLAVSVADRDYLLPYARGPREDGGLKPDVVAPSMALAGTSGTAAAQTGPYALPAGYAVGAGTSQSSPMVSGLLALLVSAAKQRGIAYDTLRLRLAVATGARFLPRYGAYEQGNGLIQVGAAWEALQRMSEPPAKIVTRAPVKTALGSLLETPGEGEGLYEREGWVAGMRATRDITLVRQTGALAAIEYDLRWVGNDGTFGGPAVVALPLNTPVAIPIRIQADTTGVHSAILNVIDRKSRAIAHQVLHTIVVAEPLTASNGFTVTRTLPVEPAELASLFVTVPPGTAVLSVRATALSGRVVLNGPYAPTGHIGNRFPLIRLRSPNRASPGQDAWATVQDPLPGVWQILVANTRDFFSSQDAGVPLVAAEASITVSALGATTDASPSGPSGDERVRWTTTNRLAPVGGAVHSLEVGSIREVPMSFERRGAQFVQHVTVPIGIRHLFVQLDKVSSSDADLDLYALFCHAEKRCVVMHARNALRAEEDLLIPQPTPGHWVIVVDPARVPTTGVSYTYTEILTHPRFGSVQATESTASRSSGEKWMTSGRLARGDVPEATRKLAILAGVTSHDVLTRQFTNGGRQAADGNPPGGIKSFESPAWLGRMVAPIAK